MKRRTDPIILAMYTALAVTIYIIENLIPKPLPFLKFGLANTVVLVLFWEKDYFAGFIIILAKSILGGFFSGLLLSPMTLISIGAGLSAYLSMLMARKSGINFSIIGISITGAVIHNVAQLAIVKWLLIKSGAVWKLLPLMMVLGILTGIVTGYLAIVLSKIMLPKAKGSLEELKSSDEIAE